MDVFLDPCASVPLYQQLRDRIVEGIATGQFSQGEGLASVRRLGVAFGVNPATISKGYDLLRSEGLVATNAKSGTYVIRDRNSGPPGETYAADWRPRLRVLLAEARAQGMTADQVQDMCRDILDSFDERP
ncbi:GntR family transcriptional regulator [Austwickia sp. TVS 96-490-7B]|uniref:GntR family transcriptional regulator n=1 Tax=Austwickia sp. TVS 96-490-7B TaxID=2830843 RepID=UPI0021085C60|nr:GntR family transcriptional regulator [Austwickia sp. TVS 96-490-7B]